MAGLSGKVALVTGAANGIGRAIAERLLDEGVRVAALDLEADTIAAAAAELGVHGGEIEPVAGDISRREDVVRAVKRCVERFGGLDLLVANAGIADAQPFLEISEASWRRIIDVNLTGTFFCIQEAARVMMPARKGAIVVTSSTNGWYVESNMWHYNASKGGIVALVRSAALDLGPYGVRVNAIEPSMVRTRANFIVDDPVFGPEYLKRVPLGRFAEPAEIATVVAFLAMDLEDLGCPELAARFLADYAEHSGAHWPASLAHHFIAYRAAVRSKVAFVRSAQGDRQSDARGRRLAALAADHLRRGAVRLMLVGGLPGTGKSTVAAHLAQQSGWVLLRSDVLRKERVGLPVEARAAASYGSNLYSPERTSETYDELLRRARTALSLGESVVLDASWSSADRRRTARALARETSSDLIELRCTAPEGVTESRLRERTLRGTDASDADVAVATEMGLRFDSWPEAAEVSTDCPLDDTADEVAALSGPW